MKETSLVVFFIIFFIIIIILIVIVIRNYTVTVLGSHDYNSKSAVKFFVKDNPFYGVTLTPNLTPNLGSFLLLERIIDYNLFIIKLT